ncbi:class I SAM-dependent methyltransferase [Lacrimispora sp.]|uniref:class I SAM-dependent methyltransferase n=1 Tax=Lacrimispora sp. TaxID=2719234 RepID=UPI0028AE0007|nr:hypothetical protein [Lacrimispora sp.]
MIAKKSDWYKHSWSLNIKHQSWVEDTQRQVNFIINHLKLKGNERILDLACGFGRHSLSFASKGFDVVGVDLTKESCYMEVLIFHTENQHINPKSSMGSQPVFTHWKKSKPFLQKEI